jgi:hypothetical protein
MNKGPKQEQTGNRMRLIKGMGDLLSLKLWDTYLGWLDWKACYSREYPFAWC